MTLTQAGRRLTLSHKAAFGEHAYDIIFFAVMVVVLAGSFVVFLISIAKANISLALLTALGVVMATLTVRELLLDTDCVTTFDVEARSVSLATTGWLHSTQQTLSFGDVEALNSEPGSIHSRRCVFVVLRAKGGTWHRLGYERDWHEGARWGGLGNIPKENSVPGTVAEVRAATGLLGTNVTSVMDRRWFAKRT